MKTMNVTIEGTMPLLMHNMGKMTLEALGKKTKKQTDIPTSEAEAEDGAYRMKSGELFVPSRAVKRALVNASGWYKIGRKSAKQFIAGCTRIEPEEIGLGTKDYEIDIRPVVIQGKNRILRSRPKLNKWKISFKLIYDDKVFSKDILREILDETGMRIGLLDNRPQKGGENGSFKVIKFSESKR